jgi:ABC-type multidrug transport system fused ATPase/permease subunit
VTRTPTDVLVRGFGVLGAGIREQWRIFALAVAGSALFAGMTVASAFVMGQVSSRVIFPAFRDGRTTAGALAAAALAILGVAVLKVVGIVGRRLGAGIMQYRLQASYRQRVTRQYLRLPLAWHQRHPTGTLLSNANADVEATWHPIAPLPFACGAVLMVVITVVALLLTDPVLALVGFVMFPAVFVVNFAYSRRMAPRMTRAQQLRAEVSAVAHESVDGALVVKTLGREQEETERFRARSLRLRDAMVAVGRVRGLFDPMMEALPTLGTLAVLAVGAARLQSGATTVADLVTVAYLFTVLALPVRAIGWVLGELPRAVVGWDRVQRVLQAAGRQAHGEAVLPVTATPAALGVDGVSFRYAERAGGSQGGDGWVAPAEEDRSDRAGSNGAGNGSDRAGSDSAGSDTVGSDSAGSDTVGSDSAGSNGAGRGTVGSDTASGTAGSDSAGEQALRDVSFDVPPGRTVAVVGPTGSGKSTLVTLLVRLVDPDTGAVLLDSTDLRALRAGGVSTHAAVVSQSAFLFDDTARGNVTLGADLGDEQVWAALRLAQADRFVRALPDGLDTQVGERGTSLSGGQRQRLALARALVRRPRLLVLDDATSSVDPAVEAAILRGLRTADLAATVVVVAYRKATIALADEVVYVEHGRVLGCGTHAELLASTPGYARLVLAYDEAEHERRRALREAGAAARGRGRTAPTGPAVGPESDTGLDVDADPDADEEGAA